MIWTTFLKALATLERLHAADASLTRRDPTTPQTTCKVTPADPEWPSDSDWASLNATIDGRLLRTEPAASSCYAGNPFGSDLNCTYVEDNWGFSAFHASQPESIDYSGWANSSCIPPSEGGTGCEIGGLPVYIVNATTDAHVATALAWGSSRNLRIVIKNTGHDLNGRSSGAFALSIWTTHFNQLSHETEWAVPGTNTTADVIIAGPGNNWGSALGFALENGRVIVSGVDKTVGVGGHCQGGGHGPLSAIYGLASDQILQATVVTTQGDILVCNAEENEDMYWAIRGGGGGQYGVATEIVFQSYAAPSNIVTASIYIAASNLSDTDPATAEAAWDAFVHLMANIPDLMDAGIAGSGLAATGASAKRVLGLSDAPPGIVTSLSFWGLNTTAATLDALLQAVRESYIAQAGNASGLVSFSIGEPTATNYTSFFDNANSAPSAAGSISLQTSRLLGRNELVNIPANDVRQYFQRVMTPQSENAGNILIIGLQAGPGPRNVPTERHGAVNPVWRETYIHVLPYGVTVNSTNTTIGQALRVAGNWIEANQETVWREWAPNTGAYMNEANPFNGEYQHDFYGSSYDRLVQIKQKYDPTQSLFVLSGVNSDVWEYNMDTGKLCTKS